MAARDAQSRRGVGRQRLQASTRRRAGGPGVDVTRHKTISATGGGPSLVGGVVLGAWRRLLGPAPVSIPLPARSSTPQVVNLLAGGRDPPVCWCPPWCGAPLRAPHGVVCPPVVGACPVCCPPLRWVLAPCAGAPRGVVAPTKTIAMTA